MKLRFLLSLFALLLLPSASRAQERQTVVHPMLERAMVRPGGPISEELRGTVGGQRDGLLFIGRTEALDLILRTTARREELEAMGIEVRTLRAGVATVSVLPALLPALAGRGDVSVITLPQTVRPALKKAITDIGVGPLRTQVNGVFSGYTGKGVIVGVVDSGIDLDHPNFTAPGGGTRILYIWDQGQNPAGAGVKPVGFNYGTEWTAADIDGGIATEKDSVPEKGHGTHVTGIAAGNGAAADEDGEIYASAGVAPESQIIFVKTNWKSTGIIDAMEYIFAKADALGLPCVINLSIEANLGSHAGTHPMEDSIDALVKAKAGRAVVVAAGNFRADKAHAEAPTAQGVTSSITFTIPPYTKQAGDEDFVAIAGYYSASDTLSVKLTSPGGKTLTKTLSNQQGCTSAAMLDEGFIELCHGKETTVGESTTEREITVYISDQSSNAASPPKSGVWKIDLTGTTVTSGSGVDFWMQSDLGTDKVAAFDAAYVDEFETVAIPGSSREAITVGAHATRLCWYDADGNDWIYAGSHTLNDTASFSGVGPTRDNRFKPDLSAPGFGVVSALAHEVKTGLINSGFGWTVINDDYQLQQGTSQAAPLVTGAVALLFEQEPGLTSAQVKSKLVNATRSDAFVKAKDGLFGNVYFGFGKLDLGPWAYTDPNETNDTVYQATLALSGQPFNGYMDRADDIDLYDLQGVKVGDTLNVSLTNLPQDYALGLQKSVTSAAFCSTPSLSTVVASNNGSTFSEAISHVVPSGPASGIPHFVRVTSTAGAFNVFVPYQVKAVITRPEQATAHGNILTAQVLPNFKEIKVSGQTGTSTEKDLYSLSIFNLTTLTLKGPVGPKLEILDKNGLSVAHSFNGTVSWQAQGQLLSSQTVFAVISGQAVPYTLTLTKP